MSATLWNWQIPRFFRTCLHIFETTKNHAFELYLWYFWQTTGPTTLDPHHFLGSLYWWNMELLGLLWHPWYCSKPLQVFGSLRVIVFEVSLRGPPVFQVLRGCFGGLKGVSQRHRGILQGSFDKESYLIAFSNKEPKKSLYCRSLPLPLSKSAFWTLHPTGTLCKLEYNNISKKFILK